MKKMKQRYKNYHNVPSQSYSSKSQKCLSILADMEEIFQLAMRTGKLSVALRAKELIGKEMGLFLPPSQRAKINDDDRIELKEPQDKVENNERSVIAQPQMLMQQKTPIQTKLSLQKELHAEKHRHNEHERREFEEKTS